MPNTISLRIPGEKKDALDKIAASLDRDRSWVINEAIDNYLDLYHWQVEHISKAVRRADSRDARWYTSDDVRARVAKLEAARRKKSAGKAEK
ncbi:MAG: ribbon-helix-helix domain-containing protein [Bryobacteraceae bacterium]